MSDTSKEKLDAQEASIGIVKMDIERVITFPNDQEGRLESRYKSNTISVPSELVRDRHIDLGVT